MIQELKQKLFTLEKEGGELNEKYITNKKQQNELREEIFIAETGIKIGDIVGFVYGEKQEGKVCAFENNGNTLCVIVYLKNENGTFGDRTKRLWTTSNDRIWKL